MIGLKMRAVAMQKIFFAVKRLYKADKTLKIVLKTLKKARKRTIRVNFKQIQLFTLSLYKDKIVKFYMSLHHSIEKLRTKMLHKS